MVWSGNAMSGRRLCCAFRIACARKKPEYLHRNRAEPDPCHGEHLCFCALISTWEDLQCKIEQVWMNLAGGQTRARAHPTLQPNTSIPPVLLITLFIIYNFLFQQLLDITESILPLPPCHVHLNSSIWIGRFVFGALKLFQTKSLPFSSFQLFITRPAFTD